MGKPTYKPVNEIPEAEIKFELKRIIELLAEKRIGIDTICKVDDRELYRFITEELFLKEMDDMMIEGMTHNFIYEEFHPNHEHDIKNNCKEFVEGLLNKKINLNPTFMPISSEIYSKGSVIKQEDAVKQMEIFRGAFDSFKLKRFEITALKIEEDTADVHFDINYTGSIEGGNEKKVFSGTGNFMLKYEYDYWCINKISIPGVSL